jgi:hypothetical protein
VSGLDNFSTDDDSDCDNVRDDPSNQPILWGPEDEVMDPQDHCAVVTLVVSNCLKKLMSHSGSFVLLR